MRCVALVAPAAALRAPNIRVAAVPTLGATDVRDAMAAEAKRNPIKVKHSGFSHRMDFVEFYQRFLPLAPPGTPSFGHTAPRSALDEPAARAREGAFGASLDLASMQAS